MPEHTSPWLVSGTENYEALRDEARRLIAESLAEFRAGTARESDTGRVIQQTRDRLFDRGWSASRDAGMGIRS
ncbi:hypothetical protein [Microbacterium sp. LWH10-1.2]|uniref:hypothetical protein n=1 Tax=Microbacterium sp. LWH10-1.2 TaxID=3135255 RepID=UPI003139470D